MYFTHGGSNPFVCEVVRPTKPKAPVAAAAAFCKGVAGGSRAKAKVFYGLIIWPTYNLIHLMHLYAFSFAKFILQNPTMSLKRKCKNYIPYLSAALANSSSSFRLKAIKVSTSKSFYFVFISSSSSISSRSIMLVFFLLVRVFSFGKRPLFVGADLDVFPSAFFTSKISFPHVNSLYGISVPISSNLSYYKGVFDKEVKGERDVLRREENKFGAC